MDKLGKPIYINFWNMVWNMVFTRLEHRLDFVGNCHQWTDYINRFYNTAYRIIRERIGNKLRK